jgi:hypothetical protein
MALSRKRWRKAEKPFVPRAVTINKDLWWQLQSVAAQRALTVPQLLLLVGNGVTRGLVDLDHIESVLVSEGWWDREKKIKPRSA